MAGVGTRFPIFLVLSALVPYLVASLGAIEFHWVALIQLAALACVIGLWYVVLPVTILVDLAFLVLLPCVLLSGYLDNIYVPRFTELRDIKVLGHLALVHLSVLALLVERRVPETRYGFIPNSKEWRVGARYFLYFIPVGIPLALILKAARFSTPSAPWLIAVQFLGFLWVVALSEEFFFRGVLQQWIEDWTWNRTAALLVTSALYGLVHLGPRRFPDWRMALITAVLGCFCGLARNRASIRASMVTHALAAATWRAFFA